MTENTNTRYRYCYSKYARHCSKSFTLINSSNPHNSTRSMLLFPLSHLRELKHRDEVTSSSGGTGLGGGGAERAGGMRMQSVWTHVHTPYSGLPPRQAGQEQSPGGDHCSVSGHRLYKLHRLCTLDSLSRMTDSAISESQI